MTWLLAIPVISSFVGYLTSLLTVKTIFSGQKNKNKQRLVFEENLTSQLATEKQVSQKLSTFSEIEQEVSNPANVEKILPLLESHVDVFLREKLSTEIPMIGMLIGEKTILKVKEVFLKELKELFPILMEQYMLILKQDALLTDSEVQSLQKAEAEDHSDTQLSGKVRSAKIVGAVLGFIFGLLQLLIINAIAK